MSVSVVYISSRLLELRLEGAVNFAQLRVVLAEAFIDQSEVGAVALDFCEAQANLSPPDLEHLVLMLGGRTWQLNLRVCDVLHYGFARALEAYAQAQGLQVDIEFVGE